MADSVVVGRDARTSGPPLVRAAIAGAQEAGSEVLDLGIESTPTVARAVDWYDAAAGLVVTASHNPPADNGFKFWTESGQAFGTDLTATLSRRVEDTAALTVSPAQMVSVRRVSDSSRRHLHALPDGDCASLSVVVDLGGTVVRTAVGDSNVATACAESGVVFGGEPSGAWIWPGETLVPDAHYAACRLVDIVASGSDLSDRIAAFPSS